MRLTWATQGASTLYTKRTSTTSSDCGCACGSGYVYASLYMQDLAVSRTGYWIMNLPTWCWEPNLSPLPGHCEARSHLLGPWNTMVSEHWLLKRSHEPEDKGRMSVTCWVWEDGEPRIRDLAKTLVLQDEYSLYHWAASPSAQTQYLFTCPFLFISVSQQRRLKEEKQTRSPVHCFLALLLDSQAPANSGWSNFLPRCPSFVAAMRKHCDP